MPEMPTSLFSGVVVVLFSLNVWSLSLQQSAYELVNSKSSVLLLVIGQYQLVPVVLQIKGLP